MAHAIPLSVTSSPAAPPVNDLVAEIFWVTVDGDTVDLLDRVPVQDGVAVYDGAALHVAPAAMGAQGQRRAIR